MASVVRTTCTKLPDYSVKAFAGLVGCAYMEIAGDEALDEVVGKAVAYRRTARTVVVPAGGDGSIFDDQPR